MKRKIFMFLLCATVFVSAQSSKGRDNIVVIGSGQLQSDSSGLYLGVDGVRYKLDQFNFLAKTKSDEDSTVLQAHNGLSVTCYRFSNLPSSAYYFIPGTHNRESVVSYMDEFLNVDENDKDSSGRKWWKICLGIGVVAVIMASVGIDGGLYH